jgi:hypothetical protein
MRHDALVNMLLIKITDVNRLLCAVNVVWFAHEMPRCWLKQAPAFLR